jgi:hypothetical protein
LQKNHAATHINDAAKNDWEKYLDDESGDYYWFHGDTGECSWEKPDEYTSDTESDGWIDSGGWVAVLDEETNKTYYFNEDEGTVVWDRPKIAEEDKLLAGWEKLFDEDEGKHYYYHEESEKTSWERPEDAAEDANVALPEGWEEVEEDETGKIYFHNESTGETVWERPVAEKTLPPGWEELEDDQGRKYYHHELNGTVWEWPEDSEGSDERGGKTALEKAEQLAEKAERLAQAAEEEAAQIEEEVNQSDAAVVIQTRIRQMSAVREVGAKRRVIEPAGLAPVASAANPPPAPSAAKNVKHKKKSKGRPSMLPGQQTNRGTIIPGPPLMSSAGQAIEQGDRRGSNSALASVRERKSSTPKLRGRALSAAKRKKSSVAATVVDPGEEPHEASEEAKTSWDLFPGA